MTAAGINQRLERRLVTLARKGEAAGRRHSSLDWDRPPVTLNRFRRKAAQAIVAQYLEGELATARISQYLAGQIESPGARACLDVQTSDELRHAALYQSYLERLDGQRKSSPVFEHLLAQSFAWNGAPEALILGFHVVVEGEALNLQPQARQWIDCPLFDALSRQIARDELRHLAFGRLYLKNRLPCLASEERVHIYRWLQSLWFDGLNRQRSGSRVVLPFLSPPRRWLRRRWQHWTVAFRSVGLLDVPETAGPPVS